MKYNKNNKPLVCMQKNSTCYKNTSTFTPKGVLWHSTGANNTNISRYVQPHESDSNYNELIKVIGKNKYGNDWNHISVQAGLNAWIGKLADGTVATVQTMPWNYRPWGCGSGSKGSCNYSHMQFEICEDNLSNKAYFNKVYNEACELTAYFCDMYNLDPYGTITVNGVKVPVILCHADSAKLGLGSNHGDVLHWFKKHGKTMDDVRKDVAALMGKTISANPPASSASNCSASIKTLVEKDVINSPDYWTKNYNKLKYLDVLFGKIASVVQKDKVNSFTDVKKAINHLVECNVIDTSDYWMKNYSKVKYLDKLIISAANHIKPRFPYTVKVIADNLNIRKGAGTNYDTRGVIKNTGVYTIVDEEINGSTKWGLLKSYKDNRDGWISLKYTKEV